MSSTSASVNRYILQLAQEYCGDCKNSFDELSKIIQVKGLCAARFGMGKGCLSLALALPFPEPAARGGAPCVPEHGFLCLTWRLVAT